MAKLSLEQFDNPATFIASMTFVMIPAVIVAVIILGVVLRRLGQPSPLNLIGG